MARTALSRWILVSLLGTTLACGTLLYPERRDMEDPGRVDPAVVLMDGALLLFFLAPGVVAFAVDIATGAIYEPDASELVRHQGDRPFEMTASEAAGLEIAVAESGSVVVEAPIWWERADGERIRVEVAPGAEKGHYRLETRRSLSPGPHRLILTDAEGAERAVPVEIL